MEEALIEMYLAGVSVRRVEDITEALWGNKVSPFTIRELNKKTYVHIEDCGTVFGKVGVIRMSMWMGATFAATEAKNLKIWPFW